MDSSRDPWLEEQIERYRATNAASAAFFHQAAQLMSGKQLRASSQPSHPRRQLSLGRLLWRAFRRLRHPRQQRLAQQLTMREGVIAATPSEPNESAQTVIVIGFEPHTKGE